MYKEVTFIFDLLELALTFGGKAVFELIIQELLESCIVD